MHVRLRVGSVLAVPVSGTTGYVAQVIRKKRSFILAAAFEATGSKDRFGPPRLVALTSDSLVRTGHWTVVGHREPDPTIPVPVYKVPASPDNALYIQDLDGNLRRRATPDEAEHLYNPVTYSAAGFQKAIDQIAGGGPLEARFAPMLPNWEYCEQTLLATPT